MDGTGASAVLVALTGIRTETESLYTAIGGADEMRAAHAILVIGALGVPCSRFLGTTRSKADAVALLAIHIILAEIPSGTICHPTGIEEALEVDIACTIRIHPTLISSWATHYATLTQFITDKVGERGGHRGGWQCRRARGG